MTTSLSLDQARVFNPYKHYALGGDHHTLISIPKCLTRHKRLSFGAKMCWARLAQYCGENGICNPSYATLGKELGIERRQAVNLVNELIDEGFLRRAKAPGSRTTHFLFTWHPVFETEMPAPSLPIWAKDCPGQAISGQSLAHKPALTRAISCPQTTEASCPEAKCTESAQEAYSLCSGSDQDLSRRQSDAHELRVKNKEKTTTTGRSFEFSRKGAEVRITPDQERYIELNTEWKKAHGRIRETVDCYKAGLRRLAIQGKLVLSDLTELETWKRERDAAEAEAKRRREYVQKETETDTQRLKQKMNQDHARFRENVLRMEKEGVRPESWFQGSSLNKGLVRRATGLPFIHPELPKVLRNLYPSHHARMLEQARAIRLQCRGKEQDRVNLLDRVSHVESKFIYELSSIARAPSFEALKC